MFNVLPLGKNYTQPFSFSSEGEKGNGVSLLGVIKGSLYPNKYIVISTYYDHESIKMDTYILEQMITHPERLPYVVLPNILKIIHPNTLLY